MEMTLAQQVSHAIPVGDASGVSEARRSAAMLTSSLGLSDLDAGRVALVVTELGTNLVKHAGDGTILLRALNEGQSVGLEVLALDGGRGMRNTAECLRDGYSTAGSPGTGFGALQRASTIFDVYSRPDAGTVVLSQVWRSDRPHAASRYDIGAISTSLPTEDVCGDGWAVAGSNGGCSVLVCDGLGHGAFAAEASRTAVSVFHERSHLAPGSVLGLMHDALRGTRGAAAAIARLDGSQRLATFSGIGNIVAVFLPSGRRAVTMNGTVGHMVSRLQEFTYDWPSEGVLIMHSDGISKQWNVENYPGLLARHPAVIGAVLYRDFGKRHDDATVVAVKERP